MSARSPGSRRIAGLAAGLLALVSCRSAAEVILDLPEPRPAPATDATATDSRSVASTGAPRTGTAATITERPPIESMPAESVLARLPRHASGQLDWTAAVDSGVAAPRNTLPGRDAPTSGPFGFDFYFGEVETYFPHSVHGRWLSCGSCHPAIYRSRGAEPTTMAKMQQGESCGSCHGSGDGSVAFAVDACERCHSALQLPAGRIAPELATDLIIPRDSAAGVGAADFPPSIFPHWAHRLRFACSACHPGQFAMAAGETPITMEGMQRGETCGACHDGRTAFGVMECGRCHRPPPEPVRAPAVSEAEG